MGVQRGYGQLFKGLLAISFILNVKKKKNEVKIIYKVIRKKRQNTTFLHFPNSTLCETKPINHRQKCTCVFRYFHQGISTWNGIFMSWEVAAECRLYTTKHPKPTFPLPSRG